MTTASLHREMVEALRAIAKRPCAWSASELTCGSAKMIAWLGTGEKCNTCIARAALEGWEKRPRLRDDEAFMEMLKGRIFGGPTGLEHLADAIAALLYGERG